MPRVKRSVHARKKRRKVLERSEGLLGAQEVELQVREGAGRALARLRLPRPQGSQARVPQALDHAHQRRSARERPLVQPVHGRSEGRERRARPEGAGRSRGQRSGEVRRDRRAGQVGARRNRPAEPRSSAGRPSTATAARRSTRSCVVDSRRTRGSTTSLPTSAGTCRCACSRGLHYLVLGGEASWDDLDARARRARVVPRRAGRPSRTCRRTRCSARGRSCRRSSPLPTGGRSICSSSGRRPV